VENLYGHCDMNNARRILSKGSSLLRGCWFWSTKLHFQKNFGRNLIAVEGVIVEGYNLKQPKGRAGTVVQKAVLKSRNRAKHNFCNLRESLQHAVFSPTRTSGHRPGKVR